jgi:hypothetical protein
MEAASWVLGFAPAKPFAENGWQTNELKLQGLQTKVKTGTRATF